MKRTLQRASASSTSADLPQMEEAAESTHSTRSSEDLTTSARCSSSPPSRMRKKLPERRHDEPEPRVRDAARENQGDATRIDQPEAEDAAATIQELRRQLAEYETLLRVIPSGISVAKDPDCSVIVSNRHHATLIGHQPDENTSIDPRASNPASFRIFKDGVEMSVDELPLHRAIAERREITDVECDVITKDGERLTLVGHAAPLFDEQHNVRGAVAAFNNITQRKRAEEKLAESERRYRNLALENARLYEEAQAALKQRDCFVARVSHELRAPLSAILGWTKILRDGPRSDERVGKALDIIERNAIRQSRLVEDLLDVSRIATTGKLRLHSGELDVADIVNDCVQVSTAAAENAGVKLVARIGASPLLVMGDVDRLHQVICNLVSNALKFAPGGEVVIEALREGDAIIVRVSDDGVGIDSEFLPHVFEQFRQAPAGHPVATRGLGLGLAIVEHIVELHGGTVRAESEGLGKGATLIVTLPAHGALEGAAPDARAHDAPAIAR